MPSELTIPCPSIGTRILPWIFLTIVLVSIPVAIFALCTKAAIVAPIIWLAFVSMGLWVSIKAEGGLRPWLIDLASNLVGRQFISVSDNTIPCQVHFGIEMCRHCFIQQKLFINEIESVEWNTGQASAMSGRDMNDWHVAVWFDHNDPMKSQKRRQYPKPDQELFIVGPSGRKQDTEDFALSLVEFFRSAGADLAISDRPTVFARKSTAS